MKLILTLALGIFCLNSSAQHAQNHYEITGHVKNLPAKWVYLRILKRNSDNRGYWPRIDSAKVIDGHFILKKDSSLLEPAWSSSISYVDSISKKTIGLKFIASDKKKHADFIAENGKTLIEGDIKSDGLTITGSKETDYTFKYGLIFPTYGYQLDSKIDSLKGTANVVALNDALRLKSELKRKFKADFKKMIIENSSTHFALVNLNQNNKNFTIEELEEFVGLFDPKLIERPEGQKLLNAIQQGKLMMITKPFPNFDYTDMANKKFTLNDVKGEKGTLVVFWASWCGPCREEIPDLKKFNAAYNAKGIKIVSISIDHDITAWKTALAKEKMTWANLSNLPGDYKEISKKYNVNAIPSMFLLDKDNRIIVADVFQMSKVIEKVDSLLK